MILSKEIADFLKYCLGNEVDMREAVVKMDWRQLFAFAQKQTILGVCLDGIERLGKEYPEEIKQNPIKSDLLQMWISMGMQIRKQNVRVNAVAAKLHAQLREEGLRCCVLKGQGNALMYPNPYARTPGDVDLWVNASREQIIDYTKKHFEIGDDIRYHHLETSLSGVSVELHFIPCTMNNPIYNRRLQAWFKRNADLQCSNVVQLPDGVGEIAVSTATFNVIYQLSHLYHHFFDEGIGMRQIIDYYYVLSEERRVKSEESASPAIPFSNTNCSNRPNKVLNTERTENTEVSFLNHESNEFDEELEKNNKNTREACSLSAKVPEAESILSACEQAPTANSDSSSMPLHGICMPLEQKHRFAQKHDLADGNTKHKTQNVKQGTNAKVALQRELRHLGLYDFAGAVMYVLHEVLGLPEERMIAPMDVKRGELLLSEIMDGGNFGKHASKYGHFTQQGTAKKYFLKIWRNMHFVRYYPAEALCEPIFRTWHFFWRLFHRTN